MLFMSIVYCRHGTVCDMTNETELHIVVRTTDLDISLHKLHGLKMINTHVCAFCMNVDNNEQIK